MSNEQKTAKKRGGVDPGAYMGGVIDRKSLKDRCRIDGQCWRWSMAIVRGVPRVSVRVGDVRRSLAGRAAAWTVGAGEFPPPGMICFRVDSCMYDDCVNPDHARMDLKANFGAWLAESGRTKGNPAKIAANRRNAAKRAKLTPDDVREIRQGDESTRALAQRLNVSRSAIQAAKSWNTHRNQPVMNGTSVFSWVPQ